MKFQIETDKALENSGLCTRVTFVSCEDDGSNMRRISVTHSGHGLRIDDESIPEDVALVVQPNGKGIYIPFNWEITH